MLKSVECIVDFAKKANPRFEIGDANIVRLNHEIGVHAKESDLAKLTHSLRGSSLELLELYSVMDGARYFINREDPRQSFYFFPITEMEGEKKLLEEWLFMNAPEVGDVDANDPEYAYWEESDEEDRLTLNGILPTWWGSAVVFAGFGCSPERLFIPTEGPHRGKVFMYEHDGDFSVEVAKSVSELFVLICKNPVEFVRKYYDQGYFDVQRYVTDGVEIITAHSGTAKMQLPIASDDQRLDTVRDFSVVKKIPKENSARMFPVAELRFSFDRAAEIFGATPRAKYLKDGPGKYHEFDVLMPNGRYASLCRWEVKPDLVEIELESFDIAPENQKRRSIVCFLYEDDILCLLEKLTCPEPNLKRYGGVWEWR